MWEYYPGVASSDGRKSFAIFDNAKKLSKVIELAIVALKWLLLIILMLLKAKELTRNVEVNHDLADRSRDPLRANTMGGKRVRRATVISLEKKEAQWQSQ